MKSKTTALSQQLQLYTHNPALVIFAWMLVAAAALAAGLLHALVGNLILVAGVLACLLLKHLSRSLDGLCRDLLFISLTAGFMGNSLLTYSLAGISVTPFRLLMLVSAVVFLAGLLFSGSLELEPIYVQDYLFFFAFWFFYAFISLAWAPDKFAAISDLLFFFLSFLLIFFTVYYIRTPRDISSLYKLWLVMAGAFLLFALFENITGLHLPISKINEYAPHLRQIPTAVFHNQNDFATFLALSFPFFLALARYKQGLPRLAAVAFIPLLLYILVETRSRANYLSLGLQLFFFYFFLLRGAGKLKLAALALGGGLLTFLASPGTYIRAWNIFSSQLSQLIAGFSLDYGSVFVRLNLIQNGLLFLFQSRFFGVGAGNVEYHMAHNPVFDTRGIVNMHNWWFDLLVGYGAIIFIAFILFYITLFLNLYLYWRRGGEAVRFLVEPLLLALVGFTLASISSSRITYLTFIWALFGYALAVLNHLRSNNIVEEDQ
ncbi:MAG: hypothetical protein GX764_08545 [Firmicutes bacterium]|nr:hypothetical protein [Bacillota bacterium]